ncbi:MAG: SAM-dependent chlorinase/fluorinase [Saprospiraceae bacterium]|nr:SAM-dependent chlorinase/fluorinase [Saprospiraceae bacterium]
MQIVTLTTDFGLKDYYVPALKGAMLTRYRALNLVDVSHNINNHDIVQAAFILKNTWQAFPVGTIHVVSVNNFNSEQNRFLAFQHEDHYFVGPDNGIFTLIFPNWTPPPYIAEIPFGGLNFKPVSSVIAEAIGFLASGQPLEALGLEAVDMVQRIMLQPVISQNQIRGSVIHIDNYDNVILNITRDLFHKIGKKRPFQLFFKRHEPISALSNYYNDVPIGETLCLFNSDYLEIAINMGKAAELLSLKIEDTVHVNFL